MTGGIYEASASKMFNIPIDEITRDSPYRQYGKVAELALGYGGSVGALIQMGALKRGLSEEELNGLVKRWRNSNPNIVRLWHEVERASSYAIRDNSLEVLHRGLAFYCEANVFFIKLPSGRRLAYMNPRLETDPKWGRQIITYEGIIKDTKQWGRVSTYGGKLVENIVQAISRDCLGEALLRLYEGGYRTVMHVHDEVVLEVPLGSGSLEEVKEIMTSPIDWAEGLPLRVECFEGDYYRKE